MSQELWRAIGEKRLRDVIWHINETDIAPNVNKIFAHGWTCLHACCERGYTEVVASFIDMGAHVNGPDWSGDTPLHHAAAYQYIALVQLLFKAKAKQVKNNAGRTPIHVAAAKGQTEMVELLLNNDRTLVNVKDKCGKTALHDAAERGSLKAAQVLLKFGADPNVTNKENQTPYDTAQEYEHFELAKYLANHKSYNKPSTKDRKDTTNKNGSTNVDKQQDKVTTKKRQAPVVPAETQSEKL